MLQAHMAAVEQALLQTARIPAGAGHGVNRGTPREWFIREFLQNHLSESLAIGQGEVIASNSRAGEARNQFDIVLYKKQFPRLAFGGGIHAFLVESVVSTIEVKSTLTKEELRPAVRAASRLKGLPRGVTRAFWTGHLLPAPLSFVIAYDGPVRPETARNWLNEIHQEEGIDVPALPLDAAARYAVASPSVDGIFLLGRGFVQFDNLPISFISQEQRVAHPDLRYYNGTAVDATLLTFFLFLTHATAGVVAEWSDMVRYLAGFELQVQI